MFSGLRIWLTLFIIEWNTRNLNKWRVNKTQ